MPAMPTANDLAAMTHDAFLAHVDALCADDPTTMHAHFAGALCADPGDGCCAVCGVAMVTCDACDGVGYHRAGCHDSEED